MINTTNTKTISMGAVELNVRNLETMKSFYVNLVGLEVINEEDSFLELGDPGNPIIKLYQSFDYEVPEFNEAGLYHSAIVFSTQSKLAKAVERIITERQDLYQGSADHIATEAFYFADPEGNGVELYYDKPRSEWQYGPDGKPLMGSIYIDEQQYIIQHKNSNDGDNLTNMGHVHLKVGNILEASRFYSQILSLEIINEMPSALFVSKDNYHHHLGMNTWESLGAEKRENEQYGLRSFSINVHDKSYFDKVITNLNENSIAFERIDHHTIKVNDPWNNLIQIEFVT